MQRENDKIFRGVNSIKPNKINIEDNRQSGEMILSILQISLLIILQGTWDFVFGLVYFISIEMVKYLFSIMLSLPFNTSGRMNAYKELKKYF